METNHKPLVSLPSGQSLDRLPTQIQRLRMRFMRHSYTKYTCLEKASQQLTHSLLKDGTTKADGAWMEDTIMYVESLLDSLSTVIDT